MIAKRIIPFLYILIILTVTACTSTEPIEAEVKPTKEIKSVSTSPIASKAIFTSPLTTPDLHIEVAPTLMPTPIPITYGTPPICQFVAVTPQTEIAESLLDKYVLSEPEPVLTYEIGLNIVTWLPGDEQLLIVQRTTEKPPERIEVFDIQERKTKLYGRRSAVGPFFRSSQPIWLEAEQAVAFVDRTVDNEYILRISKGDNQDQNLVSGLVSGYISGKPDGQQVTYFPKEDQVHPRNFNLTTSQGKIVNTQNRLPILEELEDHPKIINLYQSLWHPDGERLVYFTHEWFYLANLKSGEVCEIDWEEREGGEGKTWALSANWSPNGRYLAIFGAIDELAVPYIDLILLDMETGLQHRLDIEGSDDKYAMAWASNNRDLFVITQKPNGNDHHNLYLVDGVTGNFRQVFEDYNFMFTGFSGVAWSSNGKMIALDCPSPDSTNVSTELCLVKVEVQ